MFELTYRQAELRDMDIIYRLSNDRVVRKNSIHSENIVYEDHVKWFRKILKDEKTIVLIVEKSGIFVGQVKFNIDKHKATISLSLDNRQRGQGTGRKVISESVEYLTQKFKKINKIIALVKNDNIASIKSFEKAGFICAGEEEQNGVILGRYEKLIPRSRM